ncbi:hypothetical protein KAI87_09230 [Myxococcota bacterium]|nr:hypothetical protein [Myxococcota bacterium]
MATLLLISDAWFELAEDTAPGKYSPADRYQVLGLLVRLVARRFQGFRKIPTRRNVAPIMHDGAVGLHIYSPFEAPTGTRKVAQELGHYGFRLDAIPGSRGREIKLTCQGLAGAKIIPFPDRQAELKRSGGQK